MRTANAVMAFIDQFNEMSKSDILLCYINQDFELFEIRLAFPKKAYERSGDDYEDIQKVIYNTSAHAAWAKNKDWNDYYNGVVIITVNPADPSYDSDKIIKMLEILLEDTFPKFKERKTHPTARY